MQLCSSCVNQTKDMCVLSLAVTLVQTLTPLPPVISLLDVVPLMIPLLTALRPLPLTS